MSGLLWSVRRELWENRSLYIGPLAAATIFLLGFVASLAARPGAVDAMSSANAVDPYMYAALVIMAVGFVVQVFYCLDALYAERRDRSILFWKSLPVSDTTTVASKVVVALVVLPAITIAATIALHVSMLLSSSVVLAVRGADAGGLWGTVAPFNLTARLVYHMVAIHTLWYAPLFAWLLLASAIGRRAPWIWAGLPILAIIVFEQFVFGGTRALDMLRFRAMGGPEALAGSNDLLGHVNPGAFVQSPGLWIGLAIAVAFIAAAIRVRRLSGPN